MKTLLLSLAVLAWATPALAGPVSLGTWAANPIVVGDKTFTYVSHTGLLDSGIEINAYDLGLVHSLVLSNLGPEISNFTLNFEVAVNSGPFRIVQTRVSQYDVVFNISGGSTTVQSSGAQSYSDTLVFSSSGPINSFPFVSSVDFAVTSFGLGGDSRLSSITFDILQAGVDPVIPEPSSLILAVLSAAGLVIARCRSR